MKYRTANGLPGLGEAYDLWHEKNHYLLPSIPATDFPCRIPDNVIGCGPLLLPTVPVRDEDPELYAWLERRPTVLINLGTHIQMDDKMAREFVKALRIVLDSRPDIQIIWKLKTSRGLAVRTGSAAFEGIADGFRDPIAHEIKADRVRIVEWMTASPLAILQSGHVVCSVHHGGSNSFHEALRYVAAS